eukprot:s539_g10.t1
MFVNCSPARCNLHETAMSLNYALRAKRVVNARDLSRCGAEPKSLGFSLSCQRRPCCCRGNDAASRAGRFWNEFPAASGTMIFMVSLFAATMALLSHVRCCTFHIISYLCSAHRYAAGFPALTIAKNDIGSGLVAI